ncbi:MAG TPA: transporter [Clostridia bacterium]|nr:transporter [Clostridia bacterium]
MKATQKRLLHLTPGLALAGLLLPGAIQAQPTAHYVPGVEGIKAASLPPPGFYVRDYNVAYFSDRLNDAQGREIGPADPDAFIYANVPRLIWITEYKLLGGFLGVDALLPLQYTDLEVNTPGGRFDNSTFGIGDFFVEGTWSAHIEKFDFSLAYGIWTPTGDSSPRLTTRAGLGYWSHMFTAGATWYLDAEKKWALSALNRYEINTEKDDTDITPGHAYTLEWGASYTVRPTIDVGVVGYFQQQVTLDSGSGASNNRDQVAAIGPEISAFCSQIGVNTSLRYLYEFSSEDRLQGHTVALTLTKRF